MPHRLIKRFPVVQRHVARDGLLKLICQPQAFDVQKFLHPSFLQWRGHRGPNCLCSCRPANLDLGLDLHFSFCLSKWPFENARRIAVRPHPCSENFHRFLLRESKRAREVRACAVHVGVAGFPQVLKEVEVLLLLLVVAANVSHTFLQLIRLYFPLDATAALIQSSPATTGCTYARLLENLSHGATP